MEEDNAAGDAEGQFDDGDDDITGDSPSNKMMEIEPKNKDNIFGDANDEESEDEEEEEKDRGDEEKDGDDDGDDDDDEDEEEEEKEPAPNKEDEDEDDIAETSSQPPSAAPEEKKTEEEVEEEAENPTVPADNGKNIDNDKNDNNTESLAVKKKKKKKKRKKVEDGRQRTPKMFLDSISVVIPLDVTVDLKIAIQKTRTKRIKSIYKHFPTLKEKRKLSDTEANKNNNDDPMMDDDDDNNNNNNENKDKAQQQQQPPAKKKKKLENVPQPEQYGSVIDYLEAKYVKGVQLGDEDEDDGGNSIDGKSEGQGSVYSGGSFLDDTDLQRDVAEQVMANTTLTKLELEEDDADFFVNVGNLEVEDDQYGDNYDPLQDKENQTKKKKRKKSQTTTEASASASKGGGSAKKGTKKKDTMMDSGKSKKSEVSSGTAATKKKKSLDSSTKSAKSKAKAADSDLKAKKAKARKTKTKTDSIFKKIVALIKGMGNDKLPRRQTKKKVALTCPPNKKAGDDITFANPHNPGQRLRVKIPKDCYPGGTFKVSVPVQAPSGDDDKDHNKFSREFQELLDDYARAFDDWCSAQSAIDSKFPVFRQRVHKFDALVKEFPKSLVTPVDAEYLKKVMRRARQNKHKRMKTVENQKKQQEPEPPKPESESEEETPPRRTVLVPTMGKEFTSINFDPKHFGMEVDRRVVKIPSRGKTFETVKLAEDDFVNGG